ncbi:MAG TPA: PIG-L family deacetylase [Candidatus Limnocylindria bacterium]|nr:PIG-L family deacetylase [Candidatus Limnocylindria bacterium]
MAQPLVGLAGTARLRSSLRAALACLAGSAALLAPPPAAARRTEALVVVAPHPDDESILAADTIHAIATDRRFRVRAIYLTSGDAASLPGDCNGVPEAVKIRRVRKLREREARRAWKVLAPNRRVPLEFLRGPDQRLVAASSLVDGRRVDTLSADGERVVARTLRRFARLPRSTAHLWVITTSRYDAHGDHRTAYAAARAGAELVAARGTEVRLWSFIVHDEVDGDVPVCCVGDLHWPGPGPTHDHALLTDSVARPRPPLWNLTKPALNHLIRPAALQRHVSQVGGNPELCMPVFFPDFYTRWAEKTQEPFYEEVFPR